MPENVFTDEPTVDVSKVYGIESTVTTAEPPILEFVLEPDPDSQVTIQQDDALLGVVAPSVVPIIEVVTEAVEPTIDLILEEQAVVDISAVGMPGPPGPQGPPGVDGEGGGTQVYVQPDEPPEAEPYDIWVDTDDVIPLAPAVVSPSPTPVPNTNVTTTITSEPFTYVMPTPQTTALINHTLGHDPVATQVIVDGEVRDEYTLVFTIPKQQVLIGFDVSVQATIRMI